MLADVGVAAWRLKYTDYGWRPVTAINQLLTPPGAAAPWAPLLATPAHPDYVSGHATFSAAAAAAITAVCPAFADAPITFPHPAVAGGVPGVNPAVRGGGGGGGCEGV